MIAVLSDTHSHTGHELSGRARAAVSDAETVLHAGDFTTAAALDAFVGAASDARFHAVHGNRDEAAVRDRLPDARVVEAAGIRIAVVHTRNGGAVGLRTFGRSKGADLVVFGHSHRPTFASGEPALLNPGSHADPRGNSASHAELEAVDDGLSGTIRDRDGSVIEEVRVEVDPEAGGRTGRD